MITGDCARPPTIAGTLRIVGSDHVTVRCINLNGALAVHSVGTLLLVPQPPPNLRLVDVRMATINVPLAGRTVTIRPRNGGAKGLIELVNPAVGTLQCFSVGGLVLDGGTQKVSSEADGWMVGRVSVHLQEKTELHRVILLSQHSVALGSSPPTHSLDVYARRGITVSGTLQTAALIRLRSRRAVYISAGSVLSSCRISVYAAGALTVSPSSLLLGSRSVTVEAAAVAMAGFLRLKSARAVPGSIQLDGQYVSISGLVDGSRKGTGSAATIAVGSRNCEITTITSSGVVKADGLSGVVRGGRVDVWSFKRTLVSGLASAASTHSSGGFIEVSSVGVLDFSGRVDLRSGLGPEYQGVLLLDPESVVIGELPTDDTRRMDPDNEVTVIAASTIVAALGLAHVHIEAEGSLVVAQSVASTHPGASLGLIAGTELNVDAEVTVAGSVTLNSNHTVAINAMMLSTVLELSAPNVVVDAELRVSEMVLIVTDSLDVHSEIKSGENTRISVQPQTDNYRIKLGGEPTPSELSLSSDELGKLGSGGSNIEIGSAIGGSIHVDGIINNDSVTLTAGASGSKIMFEGAASVLGTLIVRAEAGIELSTNVTASEGVLVLDGNMQRSFSWHGILELDEEKIALAAAGDVDLAPQLLAKRNSSMKIEGIENRTVTDEEMKDANESLLRKTDAVNETRTMLNRFQNMTAAVEQRSEHYGKRADSLIASTASGWNAAVSRGARVFHNHTLPCAWTTARIGQCFLAAAADSQWNYDKEQKAHEQEHFIWSRLQARIDHLNMTLRLQEKEAEEMTNLTANVAERYNETRARIKAEEAIRAARRKELSAKKAVWTCARIRERQQKTNGIEVDHLHKQVTADVQAAKAAERAVTNNRRSAASASLKVSQMKSKSSVRASAEGLAAVWSGTESVLTAASAEWKSEKLGILEATANAALEQLNAHEERVSDLKTKARERVAAAAIQLMDFEDVEAEAGVLAKQKHLAAIDVEKKLKNTTSVKEGAEKTERLLNQTVDAYWAALAKHRAELPEIAQSEERNQYNRSEYSRAEAENHFNMRLLTGKLPCLQAEIDTNNYLGSALQNFSEAFKRSQWRVRDAKEEADEAATQLEELAVTIKQTAAAVPAVCHLPSLQPVSIDNEGSRGLECDNLRGTEWCMPSERVPKGMCTKSNATQPLCINKGKGTEPASLEFVVALRVHQSNGPTHWLSHACQMARITHEEEEAAVQKYTLQAEVAKNTTIRSRKEQEALLGPMLAWATRLWPSAEKLEAKVNATEPTAKMVEGKMGTNKFGHRERMPDVCIKDDVGGICNSNDDVSNPRCQCNKFMRKEAEDRKQVKQSLESSESLRDWLVTMLFPWSLQLAGQAVDKFNAAAQTIAQVEMMVKATTAGADHAELAKVTASVLETLAQYKTDFINATQTLNARLMTDRAEWNQLAAGANVAWQDYQESLTELKGATKQVHNNASYATNSLSDMKAATDAAAEQWKLVVEAEAILNDTWTEIKSIRAQLEDRSITNLKQKALQPRLEQLLSDAVHKDRAVMEAADIARPSEDLAFEKAEVAQRAATNLKASLRHRRMLTRNSVAMELEKRRIFRLTYSYSMRALVHANSSLARAENETVSVLIQIEEMLRQIVDRSTTDAGEDTKADLETLEAELQALQEEVSSTAASKQQISEHQQKQKEAAKKAMLAHSIAVRQNKPAVELEATLLAKAAAVATLKDASIDLFKATKAHNASITALENKRNAQEQTRKRATSGGQQQQSLLKLGDQLAALVLAEKHDNGITFNITELKTAEKESDKREAMEASGWSLLHNSTAEFNASGGLAKVLEHEAATGLAMVVGTLEKKYHELAAQYSVAQLNLSQATEESATHLQAHEHLMTQVSLHRRRHEEAVKGLSDCQCDPLHAVPTVVLSSNVELHSRKQLVLGSSNDIGVMVADGALQLHSGQSMTILSEVHNPSTQLTLMSADEEGDGDGTVTIAGKLETKGKVFMSGSDVDFTADVVSPQSIVISVTRTSLPVVMGDVPEKEAQETQMAISSAELKRLHCQGLEVGGALAGTIRVHNVSDDASGSITGATALSAPTLGAQVIFSGASSTFFGLELAADNGIVLEHNVTALNSSALLNGNVNNVSQARGTVVIHDGVAVRAAGALHLGVAASLNASMSALGRALLSATDGVYMHHSLVSIGIPGIKAIDISADSDGSGTGVFVIDDGCRLDSNSNNLTITAKEVEINGWLDSAAAPTVLLNSVRGQTFGLGGSTRPVVREQKQMFGSIMIQTTRMDLYVSNAQLGRIRSTGLTLGSASSGMMLVDGVDETNATGVGMVTLWAGTSTVKFINAESSFTKGLTVHALTGVDMEERVTSRGAPVLLNGGIGTVKIDKKKGIDTGGEFLTIAADNLAINGKVDTGDALVVVNCYTAGRSVGLGSDDSSQMQMTGPEMQNLHSGGLIMGGNCGSMVVAGVKEKHSNNVRGIVRLLATSLHESIIKEETEKFYGTKIKEETPASGESLSVVEDSTLDVETAQLDVDEVAKPAEMAVAREFDTASKPIDDPFNSQEAPYPSSELSQAEAELAGAEAEFDSEEEDSSKEATRAMLAQAGL